MTQENYQLLFEGLVDESADTLRQVKAAFIAELDFSIDQVQNALENAPLVIHTCEEELDIKPFYEALKNAGSKVLIVAPDSNETIEKPQNRDGEVDEREDDFLETDEDEESFEFVFETEHSPPTLIKEPSTKVYDLEFNPDEESAELSFDSSSAEAELIAEEEEESQAAPVIVAEEDDENILSFDSVDTPLKQEREQEEEETSHVAAENVEQEKIEDTLFFDTDASEETQKEKEEPEKETTREEQGETLDLSIPDAPIFDLEASGAEIVHKEEGDDDAGEDLRIPDEPLFGFEQDDFEKAASESLSAQTTPEAEESVFEPELEEGKQWEQAEKVEDLFESGFQDNQLSEALEALDQAFDETEERDQREDDDEQEPTDEAASFQEATELTVTATSIKEQDFAEPQASTETDFEPEGEILEEEIEDQRKIQADTKESQVQPEGIKTQKPPTNTTSSAGMLLLLVILLGIAALTYLNFFADSNTSGLSEDAIELAIRQSAVAQKKQKALKKKEAPKTKVSVFHKLEGSQKLENIELSWDLIAKDERIVSGIMKVRSEMPPERTPEEIVRGVEPLPWLRKIDLFGLNFTNSDAGLSTVQTQVRAYIEQGKIRRRVTAYANINARYNPETNELRGELTIRHPKTLTDRETALSVKKTDDGKFEIFVKSEFHVPGRDLSKAQETLEPTESDITQSEKVKDEGTGVTIKKTGENSFEIYVENGMTVSGQDLFQLAEPQ